MENLSKVQISKAVEALKALSDQKQTGDLLREAEHVQLVVIPKLVPSEVSKINVELPHSYLTSESDICLYVRDVEKDPRDYQPSIDKYEKLLREGKVTCISKVIPLKAIKTEYKEYEAKRRLAESYDAHLADSHIYRLLPSFLGKKFHRAHRTPKQVNLEKKDLKSEIDRALRTVLMRVGVVGTTSVLIVGNSNQSKDQLIANVTKAVEVIADKIPGGHRNIRNLLIKTETSTSLPLYMSLEPARQDVTLPKPAGPGNWEDAEDVTPISGAKVKVRPSTGEFRLVSDHRRYAKRLQRAKLRREGRKPSKQVNQQKKVEHPAVNSKGLKARAKARKEQKKNQTSKQQGEKDTKAKKILEKAKNVSSSTKENKQAETSNIVTPNKKKRKLSQGSPAEAAIVNTPISEDKPNKKRARSKTPQKIQENNAVPDTPSTPITNKAEKQKGTPKSGMKGTPKSGKKGTPKSGMKGTPKSGITGTPKSEQKGTPKSGQKGTPKNGQKGTPKSGKATPKKKSPGQVKGTPKQQKSPVQSKTPVTEVSNTEGPNLKKRRKSKTPKKV